MFTLQITLEEKNTLIQLIDLAVKAGGLNVANPAFQLATKINEAKPAIESVPKE